MSTTPSTGPPAESSAESSASHDSNELAVVTTKTGHAEFGDDAEQALGQGAEQGVELSESFSSTEQKTRHARGWSTRSARSTRGDSLQKIPGDRVLSNDGRESFLTGSGEGASFMRNPNSPSDGGEDSESGVDGKLTFDAHSCVPTQSLLHLRGASPCAPACALEPNARLS